MPYLPFGQRPQFTFCGIYCWVHPGPAQTWRNRTARICLHYLPPGHCSPTTCVIALPLPCHLGQTMFGTGGQVSRLDLRQGSCPYSLTDLSRMQIPTLWNRDRLCQRLSSCTNITVFVATHLGPVERTVSPPVFPDSTRIVPCQDIAPRTMTDPTLPLPATCYLPH